MVSFNEENRPSIDEIIKDEWFSEIENLNDEDRNRLEQEIYHEFEERKKIVKEKNQITPKNDTIEENRTKEANSGDIEKYFENQ